MSVCPLCQSHGGDIVWQDGQCRVVRVSGAEGEAFPGYCRVVWESHVAEMSDLDPHNRRHLMNVVFAVEIALRSVLAPDKINLATLGNMVPHIHWHVIPRWRDDSHFPAAIWADGKQPTPGTQRRPLSNAALHLAIVAALAEEASGA